MHRIIRKISVIAISLPCFVALWLVAGQPVAQEHNVKRATMPAPRVVSTTLTARALPPPNPQEELARREGNLRDHHLLGPIGKAPLAVVRAAAPPSMSASNAETSTGATTISLEANRPLRDTETSGVTSVVDEPSLAVRGSEILMTGNWYAAFSKDGGTTFSYINPGGTFPSIPGQPFCCDQVALYEPTHDLMIWFLQYVNDSNGNTGRLAVAQGSDIANQQWRFYDFTPQNVGNWTNEWFDFPDLAVSENFLYITTNMFTTTADQFSRALILRIPLVELAGYQALNYDYFDTDQDFSLRPTQGANDTMYFGSHATNSILRVFSWPESSSTISSNDVTVQVWTVPWSGEPAIAPGPDGKDWLGRADFRITAAWQSGSNIGFAWIARQDSNYPFPHVRVALIDKSTMAVVAQPHLWNSNFAFAYPAAAPNSDGRVGISVHFGGGSQFFPSHAVGVLDPSNTNWELVTTRNGTDGPSTNKWGDYLAVRPHGTEPKSWVATGFVLRGGSSSNDIEPRYIRFSLDPLRLTLINTDPANKRLKKNDRTTLRATVTMNGAPVANKSVSFTSSDPSWLTVTTTPVMTNSQGVAETEVQGEVKWKSERKIPVTAEVDGKSASVRVRVPDWSVPTFLSLIAVLLFYAMFRKRPKPMQVTRKKL